MTTEVHSKVELFVTKSCVETKSQERLSITNDLFVSFSWVFSITTFRSFEYPVTFFIDTIVFVTIEVTNRLTFSKTHSVVTSFTITRRDITSVNERFYTFSTILVASDTNYHVAVPSSVEAKIPSPIFSLDSSTIQLKFNTIVVDDTIVIPHFAKWIWRHWNIVFIKKVSSITEISIQRTREAVSKCTEVDTKVVFVFFFPTDSFIYVRLRTPRLDEFTIAKDIVATSTNFHSVEVVVARHVTCNTITQTDFQVVKVFYIFHKFFVDDAPATRDRREDTPLT